MKKLLPLLFSAASLVFVAPALATEAAKPTVAPAQAPAAPAAPAEAKTPAVGEAFTPAGNEAAMKEIIAKHKAESDAAKAKAAGGKK